MLLLGEGDESGGAVADDMHAEDPRELTEVGHFIRAAQGLLVSIYGSHVTGDHCDVVDIQRDDREGGSCSAGEDSVVSVGTCVAHVSQRSTYLLIPHTPPLFCAVDGFDEAQDHFIRDVESEGGVT
jgi:hypothetical protein